MAMAFTRPARHVAPLARSCLVRRHRRGAAKRAAFCSDGAVSTHRFYVDMDVHVDSCRLVRYVFGCCQVAASPAAVAGRG